MITVTDAATRQILSTAKEEDTQDMVLRIAVKKDDNGAFEYGMGFDNSVEDDIHISLKDIDIVVSPVYKELLKGTTLDFVQLESGKPQFIFMNPNDPNYIPPGRDN